MGAVPVMLAAKEKHIPTMLSKIVYPKLASPKMDGIRAFVENRVVLSRSRHEIPNKHVQKLFGRTEYEGHDGELIVGNPWDYNVMQQTSSGVRSAKGEPDVKLFTFDNRVYTGGFEERLEAVRRALGAAPPALRFVVHHLVQNEAELVAYEEKCIERGYEGVMLRDPLGPYKMGRSTMDEGYLIALKRFEDSEAIILSANEGNTNTNEKSLNPLGYTQRLGGGKNKIGRDTLGGFTCMWPDTGAEFNVGNGKGLDDKERARLWAVRATLPGRKLKFQFLRVGMKNGVPRLPAYLGLRDEFDV